MKKMLYFAMLALTLVACEGPQGPQGPQGPAGQDGFVNFKVIDMQINQRDWLYSNAAYNNYFIATFAVPELTPSIYDGGIVQVYREYNTGTNEARQVLLPQTRHNEYLYDAENDLWGFFTETVDYEYGVGTLSIVYTASDFDYELNQSFVPEAMHFRAVLQW